MSEENKILLSVGIISYNQEKFIGKAIRSVIEQQTSFAIEIIICDDRSTDNTVSIINTFLEKYPQKIHFISTEKNCGALKNGKNFYDNARGKYLTWLDADDHLTFPHKFQTQVDFLENNPDYNGCFHDEIIVSQEGINESNHNQYHYEFKYYSQFNRYHKDFYFSDIIERNIIPTASLVFRNNADFKLFFESFRTIGLSVVWAVHAFIVGSGKLRYFNEVWSVYNDHSEGMSKKRSLNDFKLSNIKILKHFASKKHLKHTRNSIYKTIAEEYRQILLNPQNKEMKSRHFLKIIFCYGLYNMISLRYDIINIFNYRKNLRK